MRGTLRKRWNRWGLTGIIPAYAGNTEIGDAFMLPVWDHPRVCGEHTGIKDGEKTGKGSSPRMRGTH